ncbi:MAG: hypothetical protein ACKOI2_09715 [Actinomycetota bacterium]
MTEYLEHSQYPRDGYRLDLGRLWEIDTGWETIRDLVVFANADGIRIGDMRCGEWEMAERSAVHLTVEQARAPGEILLAAAQRVEWDASMWRTHATQVNPTSALKRALDEHLAESRRNRTEAAQ